MSSGTKKPGFYSESEIYSQPSQWRKSLWDLKESGVIAKIAQEFADARRWLFVGCGSSYYLGLAAAASWRALTGLSAQAVPASELLLFPELIWDHDSPPRPVLISRSGMTSEILRVAEYLGSEGIPFLAVTCTAGEALEEMARATLRPIAAEEKSMVMTLSFTSMLVALEGLAAQLSGKTDFFNALDRMADSLCGSIEGIGMSLKQFVADHEFADYVWLGHGPFYGLACEGALKVKEMSCSYAQSFHTLEFRHGPKAIVSPETLIMFQLSESGLEQERGVLEEVKRLGGTTLVVAHQADERIRRSADLLVELGANGDEYARLAAHIVPAQLLGLYTGLKKGLDPDQPRHLSRAVILN